MSRLILAAASAIALGIAGAGPLYAQTATGHAPATPAPAPSSAGAVSQPATPPAGSGATQQKPPMASMANPHRATAAMSGNLRPVKLSRAGIRQIQSELRRDGLYHGRIDGIAGRQTAQALRAYQQHNGLRKTGRLDRETLEAAGLPQAVVLLKTGRLDRETLASLQGGGVGVGSTMPAKAATPT